MIRTPTQNLPLTQPFRWLGSKSRMRKNLYEIFKEIPRLMYIEPFGGSGAVFFGKDAEPSVYNDRERLLANFMRELRCKKSRDDMTFLAKFTPQCREFYEEFKSLCKAYSAGDDVTEQVKTLKLSDYPTETAVAFAFFYVQNFTFGGKPLDAYGMTQVLAVSSYHFLPESYIANAIKFDRFAEKLRLTNVENKDWREIFTLYDGADNLFYCDPPYESETSKRYTGSWTSDDTKELVERLMNLKASFVLSCYDGELYAPLDAICEKRYFDVHTTVSRQAEARQARRECVYVKNNAKGQTLFSHLKDES